MATTNTPKDFSSFISDLKNPDFYNKIGPAMALLQPGNFVGLIDLAASYGYSISQNDVIQFISTHPRVDSLISAHPAWVNWTRAQNAFTLAKA